MDKFDSELDGRLASLAERAPAAPAPPIVAHRRGHGRRLGVSMTLAFALALGGVATAAAGVVVIGQLARSVEGIENPGQPLHGANLECMTPPEAAAFLAAHGYSDVVWQVEAGDGTKTGGTSVQQATPPAHGFVVPGAVVDGRLHMVVDQRAGAQGVGVCNGMPMP
jgi:hypothetical protein